MPPGKFAAQGLERDPAAPAADEPCTQRLAGVMSGRADGHRERGHQIERVEAEFAVDASSPDRASPRDGRADASRPAVLSRSSKVRRLPERPTREDRLTFCTDLSAGLVPNSGARLALRTRKFTLAFGSGADNSTLPCASASSPPPLSFAFNCNGRRHAPLSWPSICEGALACGDHAIEARAAPAVSGLRRRHFRTPA